MNRRDLLKYLRKSGCVFIREGGNHSIFFNPQTGRASSVPRHNDVDEFLVKKICKDLGITPIK